MALINLRLTISILRRGEFMLFKNIKSNNCLTKMYKCNVATAGIVIIGDEILKGLTDVNTPFLIKQLNAANVTVSKAAIVPDDVDAIASEVYDLSSKCTFVLTSGGIGPTHDDVTYEAIAKACSDELQLNQELFNHIINYFGPNSYSNPGIIKYSCIPKSAEVTYVYITHNNKSVKYPVVSVRNIFIFPGVPSLLRKSFQVLKEKFIVNSKVSFSKNIYIDLDEFSITTILNEAVEKFRGCVKFGSYPTFNDNYHKVKLVLESSENNSIDEASMFLYDHLPKNSIVSLQDDILLSAKDDINKLCSIHPFIASAVSVIEEALQKYALSEICICFNGGKDCTALLHLLYSCVQNYKPDEWHQLHFLYVRTGEPFKEIEYFIENIARMYNFNLTIFDGDLMNAIGLYLKKHSNVKAMFMGTRKCDPGAQNLQQFSITDSEWPRVMRVLPLLDWTYSNVWFFLRKLQVPYCILYDRGYTSLGSKSKTVQNSLLLIDNKGFQSYKPAYMLSDHESERNSRL